MELEPGINGLVLLVSVGMAGHGDMRKLCSNVEIMSRDFAFRCDQDGILQLMEDIVDWPNLVPRACSCGLP